MEGEIFAVIDTNVVVSALISKNPANNPLAVLSSVYAGEITPIFNDEIIAEYQEVLSRDKFHLNKDDIDSALKVITDYGLNLKMTEVTNEVFPDSKDIVFYEVKMSKDDAYLVTGNIKHFPNKPFVVTPKEMVDILKESRLRK